MKKKSPVYAALDLHSGMSVLGSMEHGGKTGARMRFATEAETLRAALTRLRQARRPLFLTMEAGALTRWASAIVRPLVERLIICEPRHNRLINSNPTKSDEADVEGMCLLLRLGKLKEVWMGTDRTREIYRALVYELLNWRDAQRQLKALIKARYRQWGVPKLHGLKVFSKTWRKEYLRQLPAEEERRMMLRLYAQHDHAVAQWKETLKEVERVGKGFWEVGEFERIPGVGPFQDVGHAKLLGDLGKVFRRTFVMLRGSARDHLQVGNLGQARQNLVLDALGKVGVGFIIAPVFERKHRDAFFRRSQR